VARNLGCDYHSSLGCESTETVQPLIEVLGDEDAFVRLEVVRSLGERALPEARSALEDVVQNDRRWEVREAAAFALGNIGSAESLVILHELLEDDQPRVAAAAQEALRRVGAVARIGAGGAGSAGKVKVLVDPGRGAVAPSAVGDGSASADGGP
jgi:HEAT repeat protein